MPRQLPPLNSLRAFEVAARHLSFTRAGEELFVTAAAISHQIKTLEESLGIMLFDRKPKSLMLTDAGRAYLPAIQGAFSQLTEATYRLHADGERATLKVNIPPTFAVKWLIPRMDSFMKLHPEIDIKVSTSKEMVDFSREDFDLAIRYGRGVYPGLHCELCLPVEVFPVCSPALMKGKYPLRTSSDLRHHTLLHDASTYKDSSNPDWTTWFRHACVEGIDATRGPSFWPSHIVIDAALDGLGVALAKRIWVERDLAAGYLTRPFDLSLPVEFAYYVIYPESRLNDQHIRQFIDWIQSEIAIDNASPPGGWQGQTYANNAAAAG
jgi:LysR family glycine cleavage system transcriptional activator